MRHLIVLLSAALLLFVAVPVGSQPSAWIEYRSSQDFFSISLPGQLTIRDITYKTLEEATNYQNPAARGAGYGLELPGRVYSVEDATGRYSVTVVDFPANRTRLDSRSGAGFLMVQASWALLTRQQAEPTQLSAYSANSVSGHELHLLNAD